MIVLWMNVESSEEDSFHDPALTKWHTYSKYVSPIYYPIDPGTDLAAGGVPTGAFQTRNHSSWKIMLFAQSDNHELVDAEATAR